MAAVQTAGTTWIRGYNAGFDLVRTVTPLEVHHITASFGLFAGFGESVFVRLWTFHFCTNNYNFKWKS